MSEEEQRLNGEEGETVEKFPSTEPSTNPSGDPHWPLMHEPRQFADAGALGLCGFCLTAFVTGLYFAGAKSIAVPNVFVGLATFYGGTIEVLCGIWEMARANTFMATLHGSFGALWISLGAIYIPSFGIVEAYVSQDPEQFTDAVGFFFVAWGILAFIFFTLSFKTTLPIFLTFLLLTVALFCMAAGFFSGSANTLKAAGILLVVTSFVGWYIVYSSIANKQNTYLTAYPIHLPDFTREKKKEPEPAQEQNDENV